MIHGTARRGRLDIPLTEAELRSLASKRPEVQRLLRVMCSRNYRRIVITKPSLNGKHGGAASR